MKQVIVIIFLGFYSLFLIFIFSQNAPNNTDKLFRIGMGLVGLIVMLYGILTFKDK